MSVANAQRLGPDAKRPRLAADADPNDAAAYIALGTRQIESSTNDAAAAFCRAARLDPSSADAMYGRAISLVMRKPVLVKLYFEGGRRARDNKELKALGSSKRAWLYYSQGRLPQALLEYDDAIRASKQPGYLRFDKARVYVMQGLVKPALDELTLALEALRTQDDDKKGKVVCYDSKAIAEHGILRV